AVDRDCAHVQRVTREEVLTAFRGASKSRFEERERRSRGAAGAQLSAALEIYAHIRQITRTGQGLGLLQQPLARIEFLAKTFHTCELRQHLGATGVGLLGLEEVGQPPLRRVQVVKVPQWPQAIRHAANCRTSPSVRATGERGEPPAVAGVADVAKCLRTERRTRVPARLL